MNEKSLISGRYRFKTVNLDTGEVSFSPWHKNLVMTGDGTLDAVVPVQETQRFAAIWPHARVVTIERTGHLGSITRPDEFARLVMRFLEDAHGREERRHVG